MYPKYYIFASVLPKISCFQGLQESKWGPDQSMHLMTCLSILLVEEFQPKLYNVDLMIKYGLTTTALMLLTTKRMLILFGNMIGPSCCEKSMLHVQAVYNMAYIEYNNNIR